MVGAHHGSARGGKTALALNNYAREALRASIPVLVFSLEMRSDEVNGRLVAAESVCPSMCSAATR